MNRQSEISHPIEVAAGVIWQERRILAALRPDGKAMSGYWEFPGGKVEPGELPEAALIRELREELSIEVKSCCFWKILEHKYPQARVRLHFFHVTAFDGQPVGLERQALRWVLPEDALEMNFLPPDFPLLKELAFKSGADFIAG